MNFQEEAIHGIRAPSVKAFTHQILHFKHVSAIILMANSRDYLVNRAYLPLLIRYRLSCALPRASHFRLIAEGDSRKRINAIPGARTRQTTRWKTLSNIPFR